MNAHVRVTSPFGEHFIVCDNAPDWETSNRVYRLMTRVRAFDATVLADETLRAYENESRDIGEDGR